MTESVLRAQGVRLREKGDIRYGRNAELPGVPRMHDPEGAVCPRAVRPEIPKT